MLWVLDVQPKPCTTDAVWSISTFDPFSCVNDIKLELKPNAKEFTPKEKVRSLSPYADPFKPLLAHPFKLNPLATKFRPASVLNPTVVLFYPAARIEQKSSKLSPHAAEFVPAFGSNPLANGDSQSEHKELPKTLRQVVPLKGNNLTTFVDAARIVSISEKSGETVGTNIVRQRGTEYFLRKEEKKIEKLQNKISRKYNFFRKQKLQKQLAEHEAVYELLFSFLNKN